MSEDKVFCAVCCKSIVTNDSVHVPMTDDSIGYMHPGCWLGQGIAQMFQAIDILTQSVQTWMSILQDKSVQDAVGSRVIAMAKERARQQRDLEAQAKAVDPGCTVEHGEFGTTVIGSEAEAMQCGDAVAVCPSATSGSEIGA